MPGRKGLRAVRRSRIGILVFIAVMAVMKTVPVYAMEAPGDGEDGWYYMQNNYHWCYYDEARGLHKGWLKYNGEWYWFDDKGWMASGGNTAIDGASYYFFINGNMAWNQYVGMKFYGEDGQPQSEHDVRVIGSKTPDSEERDLFSDYMYQIPRSWIARFVRDGWQMMFYKQKKYFAAPKTGEGIYYVYHSVDTHYKKVKFTDVDSLLQAFGEYVGYAAGCYEENNAWMDTLWEEQAAVLPLLEMPDYYEDDADFYFGCVFAAYLDEDTKESMMRLSPAVCNVMEEILHMEDDEETRIRLQKKAQEEQEAAARRAERIIREEGYGPGVKREIQDEEKKDGDGQDEEEQGGSSNGI